MENVYEEYKKYLGELKTKYGNPFTKSLVDGQINTLSKRLPEKLNEYYQTNIYKNLFLEKDINKLIELKKQLSKKGDPSLYEWDQKEMGKGGGSSSLYQYIKFLKDMENIDYIVKKEYKIGDEMRIKNIILYGAPGVGKTHNYKNLISYIEKANESQEEIFNKIKENKFCSNNNDEYKVAEEEERVEFITFHQSFGYEDFIEGFRPSKNGNISLANGVFKQFANDAKRKNKILEDISKINFNDYIEEGQEFITKKGKKFIITKIDEDITFKHENSIEFVAYRDKIIEHLHDEMKMNGNEDGSSQVYIAREIYKKLNKKEMKNRNFYLVIDEINRGNISKIFGELITLIEESKRDNYDVTLPYSKEKFSVPSNLFIIGTMNTTDKSIALIDVALRRRFTFIKMQPNKELVIKSFRDTFEKLNDKIKEDLGEEYQIGHSYFMNIEESELTFIKEYKIKPLLEEYYYGDDKLEEILKILDLK